MSTLGGAELEAAQKALLAGYRSWDDLSELVLFALDVSLTTEVGGRDKALKHVARDLLEFTEAHGWSELLLREAQARRDGNATLRALVRQLGLAPAPLAHHDDSFQAEVVARSKLQSTGRWRRRMTECERAVVQIMHGREPVGTGVLVAPARVLSNWHVFQSTQGSGELGALREFNVRLDFRAADHDAPAAAGGSVIPLADMSRPLDASHMHELDYVIVQMAHAPAEPRGYITLGTRNFEAGETALVLQHPRKRTLQLADGTVQGWLQEPRRRIYRHNVTTDNGSSGSPVFAADWTMLALHHRAGPKAGAENRAIATSAILARMGHDGTLSLLPEV